MDNDKKDVVNKLREYARIDRDIAGIQLKIRMVDDSIMHIRTSRVNDESKGNGNKYVLEEMMDKKVKLETLLKSKYLMQKNFGDALRLLDREEIELLSDLYFKKETILEICIKRQYSRSNLHRKKDKALENLSKLILANNIA